MEKLIRFINEYGHTSNCGPFETCRIEPATERNSSYLVLSRDDNGEGDGKDWHLSISRLISKEYGFIERLDENDKIDIDKVIDTAKSFGIDTYYYEEGIDDIYIPLLMVLAVKDNPIEYLLSVIK